MTASPTSWRRRLLTGVWVALAVYLGLLVALTLMQRRLIYLPVTLSPDDAKIEAAGAGLLPWTNSAGAIIGWQLPADPHAPGTILMIHGTDGWAVDRAIPAKAIRKGTGFTVYILEYPGYGARPGSPGEASILAAADEAWQCLPHQVRVYLVAESLGAGPVAHLAGEHPSEIAGIAMFAPYDRLTSVAQHHLPVVPVSLLLRDQFAPVDWMANYHGPVKVVVSGADGVIPPASSRRLYDSLTGPKSLEIIPGAGHMVTMDRTFEWWRGLRTFWESNTTLRAT